MISRLTKLLPCLLAVALFQGCSVLPERTARATFMLPPPMILAISEDAIPLTVRVLTPYAESPVDSTGILVNPNGHVIQSYSGARWTRPAPDLVRDHWIDGLRQTGSLQAVVNETSNANSDLILSSDLNHFRIQYRSGKPIVVIQLDARILESRSRRVVAARRFEVEHAITDQPVEAVVSGFGEASQILTQDLASWLLTVSREVHTGRSR